jgi:hypothetical protein
MCPGHQCESGEKKEMLFSVLQAYLIYNKPYQNKVKNYCAMSSSTENKIKTFFSMVPILKNRTFLTSTNLHFTPFLKVNIICEHAEWLHSFFLLII